MNAPEKVTANELIKQHGHAGWLIVRLQRYAMLGWGLFFVLLLFILVTILLSSLVPRPIIVVDESGRLLANIEHLKPTARSDQELLAASMEFTRNYLSLTSSDIYDDYAIAMNMMGPELRAITTEARRKDNYLKTVELAKTRSRVEFSTDLNRPSVLERKGLMAFVRLRGNLVVTGEGSQITKPFDVTLTVAIVARNTLNTAGIQVLETRDN